MYVAGLRLSGDHCPARPGGRGRTLRRIAAAAYQHYVPQDRVHRDPPDATGRLPAGLLPQTHRRL